MRFIHVADLHFDRTFEGVPKELPADFLKKLNQANEKTLKNIITSAINQNVDFVIFAGDTFHQKNPSLKNQQLLMQQFQRLEQVEIPVYLIFGNHDYYDENRYWFSFPKNVVLFEEEKVKSFIATTQAGERYAVSGFSYRQQYLHKSMTQEFPMRNSQVDYHIGLYHGDVQDANFAPFNLSELKSKNYDYWALGHIHQPTQLSEEIIYPGTPQGHTKKELDLGNVLLVDLSGDKVNLKEIPVAAVRWQKSVISLAHCENNATVLNYLKEQLTPLATAQTRLLEITLTETQHLVNFADMIVNGQLQDLLNQQWPAQIFVHKLAVQETKAKISLPASDLLKKQLLQEFSHSEIFKEVLADLATNKITAALLEDDEFCQEVLEQVTEELDQQFEWGQK
ncbi:DNA repair exonuclease [Enterococcus saigonensis]|uniref:DNA repair exonuclease n=1 Tax=Enterococcus saigonensis TaxID=1805431 RepID=A0A679IG36_9ENTE|nr:DNA repair exonuclease [Enterococcus saigonensis]BCA84772.1 DNA repair exonuclease [Enterococcus saigonensis]